MSSDIWNSDTLTSAALLSRCTKQRMKVQQPSNRSVELLEQRVKLRDNQIRLEFHLPLVLHITQCPWKVTSHVSCLYSLM
jgi:hypothetical protein